MIICRYVGGEFSVIGDLEFDAIGQKAEFGEQGFAEALLGGALFLPDKLFSGIRFTDEELRVWGPAGERDLPSAEFCEKLAKAQQLAREIRATLARGRDVYSAISEFSTLNVSEGSIAYT